MLTYEFICPNCGENASALFHADESHDMDCPNCGAPMKKNYQAMIPSVQYEQNDSLDYNLTGEPIVYHTKGQLKEIAKVHGCEMIS